MKSLSICMIVKNEEKNIQGCIDSIKEIADEIVIVDTGSTDNTVNIAKESGAKVIIHKWNNDFSEARNTSLDAATKDWILFLDADERIDKSEHDKLKYIVNNCDTYEGYYLRLVNIIKNIDVGDSIVLRMFKNKPEYRFEGKMHEQIVQSIQQKGGLNCIGSTDIRILHYGYDPELADMKSKYERNINLLKSYDEKDKDGYYYYVLGNEYARMDDFENAYQTYQQALKLTNRKCTHIFYPYLLINIAKIHSNSKKFAQSLKFIQSVKSTLPNFRDLYFMECMANIECGKVSDAIESINNYENCKVGANYEYPNNNFDKIYDIKEMKNRLEQLKVNNEDNLLSGLMFLEEYDDKAAETIKTFNEIVSNFVVVVDGNKNIDIEYIKSVGAQVIHLKNMKKKLYYGLKECRGKYVILVESGEICTYNSQKEITEILAKNNYEALNLITMDMLSGEYKNDLKIIRNNKKVMSLDEYKNKLASQNKKIVNTTIYLKTANDIKQGN
ncbi:tetratricopeptide repeat-containing glycosyltransferase family 2 protein [Clostridium sp.]|uniref:tetratricopeptide repeat-containing glycosyltransferase family 2 protein n=1 Tax=Clostridium sp. TaxID=1506 RepID=UPI003F38EABC